MKRAKARAKKPRKAKKPAAIETALAAFAHDVRTPLTGVLAISDLLVTAGLPERERQWAQTIKASAEHLADLTTLFVDAAKQRHGGLTLRNDLFDLDAFVRSVAQSLTARAAAKGLQSRVSIARNLPVAKGDAVRLRAALENLIDNAVKFTDRGHVALRVSATPASGKTLTAHFVISDSGIGLSVADIRRLFRPFSQASVDIASRFGGAGLGLSSVRSLARAMGGDVGVVAKRKGAEFALHVVLQRAATTAGSSKTGRAKKAPSLDILCVEDNPFGRVVVNAILTELGHHADFAARGEDAIDMAARRAFDVALIDMILPGIDGAETIRRLRAGSKNLRIVAMSGRSEGETAARAAGADDFLQKPVSPRAVAQALAR